MRCAKDKVTDVLAVLAIMKKETEKTCNYRDTTELRKEAVHIVAETEVRANRYKNMNSAKKTIHDACARRLRPDVSDIIAFDMFADGWLRQNSSKLKDILLGHSESHSQSESINNLFNA